MTLNQFITQYTGKAGVGDTPENKGQCVGLIEVWLDNLGLNTPHLYGNAKALLQNADPSKFDIIPNSPTNVPQAGDVIVWGASWGNGYGHTGIFCSGDVNSFSCFQQNDPTGSTPHAKTYSYTGVIGWLHPKAAVQAPTSQDALAACLAQHEKLVTEAGQKDATINNLNQQITSLNQQLASKDAEVDSLKNQLTSVTLRAGLAEAQAADLPSLKDQLAQAEKSRETCLAAQETQNKQIAQLKNTSYTTAKVGALVGEVLLRVLERLKVR